MPVGRRSFVKATCGMMGGSMLVGQPTHLPAQETKASRLSLDPLETEILVVGAGASGIPAAITAARCGVQVLLIDEDPVPGGAPVDNYVTLLCGWPRVGIFREMVDRLQSRFDFARRPVKPEEELTDHWYLPSSFLQVFHEMIHAEKNLTFMGGCKAVDVRVDDVENTRKVSEVIIERAAGIQQSIKTEIVIDATGTAGVAELAGCETLYGREAKEEFGEPHAREKADKVVMPCTWMYISQKFGHGPDFDFSKLKGGGFIDSGLGWFKGHETEFYRRSMGIHLHWGSTVICKDTRDPYFVAVAQQEALEKIKDDLAHLMENGYAVHLAPRIGIRESRRVVGDTILTMNDLKSGQMPEDIITTGQYYLDVWGEKLTEEEKTLPVFGIPYRSILAKGVQNILVVGKAISGTHIALSAYRIQPIVAGIGTGAGVAASLAISHQTQLRSLEMKEIQAKVREFHPLP